MLLKVLNKVGLFKEKYKYISYSTLLREYEAMSLNIKTIKLKKTKLVNFRKKCNIENFFNLCFMYGTNNFHNFLNFNNFYFISFDNSENLRYYLYMARKNKLILKNLKDLGSFFQVFVSLYKLKIYIYITIFDYKIINKII
jgi:hypothetical protein